MTPLESAITHPNYRPLPGHCVIYFDSPPSMSGLIHIPETSRKGAQLLNQDKAWSGVVLHMTPRGNPKTGLPDYEDFEIGDRVITLLTLLDLDQSVISTLNTRIYAVIEPD